MAEGYNAPKDEGYQVSNNYGPVKQTSVVSSGYGGEQSTTNSLPIYQVKQEQTQLNRKSRCPKGAILGQIGSCCGMQCTRACALEG